MSREWNAEAYDRISSPQAAWGTRVLDRLALRGDERVIDAGCGTGRLTEQLLGRLPRGRIVGLDLSSNMLAVARERLAPRFGTRVALAQAHLLQLPIVEWADVVFSTATFHWVLDHPRLFRELRTALRPGGRLVAQCGGAGNLERFLARTTMVIRSASYARFFDGWVGPWYFADPTTTRSCLEAAGFTGIVTSLEQTPTTFPSADAFREFVTSVVLRHHLVRLPDERLRTAFVEDTVNAVASSEDGLALDYVRLNIEATAAPARSDD